MRTRWLSVLALLLALVGAGASSPARGAARPTGASCAGCQTFLPIVSYAPTLNLLAPPNGSVTQSLAPILQWSPPITGTYQIQVSDTPAFLPTTTPALSETKTVDKLEPVATLFGTNLPQQTTFYWRVGLRQNGEYVYAPAYSFTTPVKVPSLLPPGVRLIAPANNATVGSTSVVLQWQGVPNTLFYRVRVYYANNVLFSAGSKEVRGDTTSLSLTGLTPGQTYYWKVKALNEYGWGPYLQDYYFTVP